MAQFRLWLDRISNRLDASYPFDGNICDIIIYDPAKSKVLFSNEIIDLEYDHEKMITRESEYNGKHYISKSIILTTREEIKKRRDEKLTVDEAYIIQRKNRSSYYRSNRVCNIYLPIEDAKISNIHYEVIKKEESVTVSYNADFGAFSPALKFSANIWEFSSFYELLELENLIREIAPGFKHFFDTEKSTLENYELFYSSARRIYSLSKRIARNREKRNAMTNEEFVELAEKKYAKEFEPYSTGHAYPPPLDGSMMEIREVKEEI